jgi:TrmH family RNA methyltransferase
MISSLDNPQIKRVLRLRKEHRRKKAGLVLIEGQKEVSMAVSAGWRLSDVFYCPSQISDKQTVNWPAREIHAVSEKVFKRLSVRQGPDGLLALAQEPDTSPDKLKMGERSLVLVADNLEKPGNLGAIIRTADAAGLAAVFVTGEKVDIYNYNVIRASRGSVFALPVVKANRQELKKMLLKKGFSIITASPEAKKVYTQADMAGKAAIVVGSENQGVSPDWLGQETQAARIPMLGQIDSLNASVSAALFIYEALRQRSAQG